MILPMKARDKTPSPTSGQQDRGKAIASGSKKRNTRSHSRGLPSKKVLRLGETSRTLATARPRQTRILLSNRESSPIEADEEDTKREDAPQQASFRVPTLAVIVPSSPEHVHSDEQRLDLFLSQAKQVYLSGGKVPLNGGTSSKDVAAGPEVGAAKDYIAPRLPFGGQAKD
ncbi:hypothetical protein PIB30_096366 [Stylosanthes scabra]|uniref:Uncharacterized protein n=1 Tax=Stylosanthes scabra TaxID=79078 RepID=A0ABU6VUD6_9FABA|nr:hypothetical protein [Stylosanthes scabra]